MKQLLLHPVCRVCQGTKEIPARSGGAWKDACTFCDDAGRARFVCPVCGEALPLCPCFGALRGVASTAPATTATSSRRTS